MAAASAAERMAEPSVRCCLGKYVDKGEDAWLEKPASVTKPVVIDQGATLSRFPRAGRRKAILSPAVSLCRSTRALSVSSGRHLCQKICVLTVLIKQAWLCAQQDWNVLSQL